MPRRPPIYDELAAQLRAARDSRGWTQRELAERLKTSQSFVARYERGARRLDIVEFVHVADVLKLDIDDALRTIRRRKRG